MRWFVIYETSSSDEEGDETTEHPGNVELAWFPSGVSMMGFDVDISKAKASRKSDEESIKQWVGQHDLETDVR